MRFDFSTLLGGSGTDNLLMPTVDAEGHLRIVGNTGSPDFPVTPGMIQSKFGGGTADAFCREVSTVRETMVRSSVSGTALAAGIASDPERVASAIPLTYLSHGAKCPFQPAR